MAGFTIEVQDSGVAAALNKLAERVRNAAGSEIERQIRVAYQFALAREPRREEIADAEPVVRDHGLVALCRALYNSNEFLFFP